MTPETPFPVSGAAGAEEINRLHAEVGKLSADSRGALHAALIAAWKAGQLLALEKRRVRRSMGPGAWLLWLERYFSGTPRSAQRYMRLAKSVSDPSFLGGLSLRQTYFRLGIATEPKSPGRSVVLRPVARHAVLAARLVGLLKARPNQLPADLQRAYEQDLRPLYERLRALFEPGLR
ncbi:MAG TPA: hypothetical protein VGM64_03340 [Lacunisphaera sp.]|jgi:hypothetical protein